jgi:hypothetical protein
MSAILVTLAAVVTGVRRSGSCTSESGWDIGDVGIVFECDRHAMEKAQRIP